MPFNVNQFIRKVSQQTQPKIEVSTVKKVEQVVPVAEVPPVKYEEPKQEIVIPVYVPDSDSESEFSMAPVKRKPSPSFKVDRKVVVNPLNDA